MGKRGVSTTIGTRGAHVTVSDRGTRTTVGLPGTGLTASEFTPAGKRSTRPARSSSWTLLILLIILAAGVLALFRQ